MGHNLRSATSERIQSLCNIVGIDPNSSLNFLAGNVFRIFPGYFPAKRPAAESNQTRWPRCPRITSVPTSRASEGERGWNP